MAGAPQKQTIFMTAVGTPSDTERAGWLIDSLRSFGGRLAQCPVWLFEVDPQAESGRLAQGGLTIFPLQVPDLIKPALFAEKVVACAQAEALAGSDVGTLVWIDPGCLVVNPPELYELDVDFAAAFRPVHIQNIGLRTGGPVDVFWHGIYTALGLSDVPATVQSFVDQQTLRAYYNSHAFAIDPALGLMARWLEVFQMLVCDAAFQQSACQDAPHQVFLFQALLSALLSKDVEPGQLRILPPVYNYPLHLHRKVPAGHRPRALNELVSFSYEDRSLDPVELTDIAVEEPLRSWLEAHCAA